MSSYFTVRHSQSLDKDIVHPATFAVHADLDLMGLQDVGERRCGEQYASAAHRGLLEGHRFQASMSRRGNCWDNAVAERFFLNVTMERVWQRDYADHGEATRDIADYIVGFYNTVRIHSTLGGLPPNAYEQTMAAKQPIDVSEKT